MRLSKSRLKIIRILRGQPYHDTAKGTWVSFHFTNDKRTLCMDMEVDGLIIRTDKTGNHFELTKKGNDAYDGQMREGA